MRLRKRAACGAGWNSGWAPRATSITKAAAGRALLVDARFGHFAPNREVDELRWLAPAAADLMTYEHDRALSVFGRAPRAAAPAESAIGVSRASCQGPAFAQVARHLRPLSRAVND